MKKIIAILGLAVMALSASPALAAQFMSSKTGTVTVIESLENKNIYVAGSNVNVNGNVAGDLFVAGGTVTVNKNVEQDLFLASGTGLINGTIGGDLRAAGGNLVISGSVGGDLLVAGGTVSVNSSSSIAGDLIAGSGNLDLQAPVNGSVRVGGGNIYINSKIKGNVSVNTKDNLTFGPQAVVTGKVSYTGVQPAKVESGAQVGTIEFHKMAARSAKQVGGLLTVGFLILLLAYFIAAWVLNRFYPSVTSKLAKDIYDSPMGNFGWGLASLIIIPIASVLLFITFVGFYLGLMLIFAYILALIVSSVIATIYLGSAIWQWYSKSPVMEFNWKTALLGAVVMKLIMIIPFIGGLVSFILALMAFGAIIKHFKPQTKAEPVVV